MDNHYPEEYFKQGVNYYNAGMYREAVAAYIKAELYSPDRKYPIASFNKGLSLHQLENYEQAIQAFTKAEQDSPEGKYPMASCYKGLSLLELGKYEEAIASYTKAEQDSPEGNYPMASCNKGLSLDELGKYEEAIASYTKAEQDSPEGKYPLASYNKGVPLDELGKYEEAIASYTKAEQDSPEGKYPLASCNKGLSLDELGKYEEAIASYTKAEQDSPDGKYPDASYSKGLSLHQLGKYEEAIASYTKAEQDSPEGKYPLASCGKGVSLHQLGKYEEAIASYTKAEQDSPEGKYPMASCNKGVSLHQLGKYEEAIASYTKAEQDSSEGKYPNASCNKGFSLHKLGKYEEAIASYTKAEQDSPEGKYPNASCNKGICYYYTHSYQLAIVSLRKAIAYADKVNMASIQTEYQPDSSETKHLAHLYLSKALLANDEKQGATPHAFIAMQLANGKHEIIENIIEHFCSYYTVAYYKSRVGYIDAAFQTKLAEDYRIPEIDETKAGKLLKQLDKANSTLLALFHSLVKTTTVTFPLQVTQNIVLSQHERLKLAYLLHIIHREPWHAFHIIDHYIDGNFEMDGMDYYFYAVTAYHIAAPIEDLAYFTKDIPIKQDDVFYKDFKRLSAVFSTAIYSGNMHDPYLLNIPEEELKTVHINIDNLPYHPWVNKGLLSVIDAAIPYQLPLTAHELLGIASGILKTSFEELNQQIDAEHEDWKNVKRALLYQEDGLSGYKSIVYNIRKALKNKVSHTFILGNLFEMYENEKDENKKYNLAIMQAATIISYRVDVMKQSIVQGNNTQMGIMALADLAGHKSIGVIVACGELANFGIGIAISLLGKLAFSTVEKNFNEKADKAFEDLLTHIR